MMPSRKEHTVAAANGESINLVKHTPAGEPLGAIIVAPAIATPRRFYEDFTAWLASAGFLTYSFDYQGYGASTTAHLRDVTPTLFDWGADSKQVHRWVLEDAGGLPLTWLGHSLGGQLLPFIESDALAHAIIITSGTGYWGHSRGHYRLLAPLLWYALGPTLTKLYGYFPGRKYNILGDLPASVMQQWTSWCKHPDYLFGPAPETRELFETFSVPLTSLSFTDDGVMSGAGTDHLLSFYTGTSVSNLRLTPESVGVSRVGHMGFFQERSRPVWEGTLLPLLAERQAASS